MHEVKEFFGKDVDEAIDKACDFFNAKRERLEIEIQQGGSTGIFGLVGVKKAVIKARIREKTPMDEPLETPVRPVAPDTPVARSAPERNAPPRNAAPRDSAPRNAAPRNNAPAAPEPAAPPEPLKQTGPAPMDVDAEVKELVETVLRKLLTPIIGDPKLVLETEPGRIKALVDDQENSGLIIGREGQTIAALQYLANRIVARKSGSPVRVHLDAGDYRERQDENLRKTALFLADKAKAQGRTQSTRPLSSYHRRVVHLALQDHEAVQTKSKGEGPMKRVLILPRADRESRRMA